MTAVEIEALRSRDLRRIIEIEAQLFPDKAALTRDENRRWELTVNHWDLPIRQIDPHEDRE